MRLTNELREHLRLEVIQSYVPLQVQHDQELMIAMDRVKSKPFWHGGQIVDVYKTINVKHIETEIRVITATFLQALQKFNVQIDDEVENFIFEQIDDLLQATLGLDSLPETKIVCRAARTKALIEARTSIQNERLKGELTKMSKRDAQAVTNNYHAWGSNSRFNFHSTDMSTNSTNISVPEAFSELVRISAADSELNSVAEEAKRAWPDKKLTSEKLSEWVQLASSSVQLMKQAGPFLEHIYHSLQH